MASKSRRRAYVVVGLGFGDEGKGAVVDYLTRTRDVGVIVRYNGGAQAAHNVVTPEGVHHTFSQFGSGTLANPDVLTYLGPDVLVNPHTALNEAEALKEKTGRDPLTNTYVSPYAWVTTSYHVYANLSKEFARGKDRHGTTGMGIGETRRLANMHRGLQVKDLSMRHMVENHMKSLREFYGRGRDKYVEESQEIDALMHWRSRLAGVDSLYEIAKKDRDKTVVFEGAQGVLLDQDHGFHPHTTWSDTTTRSAMDLIDEELDAAASVHTIGVLRTYSTRHGEGPFPAEKTPIPVSEEMHNRDSGNAGLFRTGPFDLPLTRYAIKAVGEVDSIFLTHMDASNGGGFNAIESYVFDRYAGDFDSYFDDDRRNIYASKGSGHSFVECVGRRLFDAKPDAIARIDADMFIAWVSANTGVPVRFWSEGPTYKHVREVPSYV